MPRRILVEVDPRFRIRMRQLREERGLSFRDLEGPAAASRSLLNNIENGKANPSVETAQWIDRALDAGGELAAMVRPRARPAPSTRDADAEPLSAWPAMRHTVTVGDVQAVRAVTATFRALDNRHGGGHAYPLAAHYLKSCVEAMLISGGYTDEVGRSLFAAASELAHLAAWTAYDTGAHSAADRYFAKALELCIGSDDAAFGGEILVAKGHHAIHLGRPDEAVELAKAGQHAARTTSTTALLAEALALEANGQAVRGDRTACVNALAAAERSFDRVACADGPGWLTYFDDGYLAARIAHILRDLGDWDQAAAYAHAALSMTAGMARTRAFNTAMLATIYVDVDLEQAHRAGLDALELATALQSARAIEYLTDFRYRLNARYPGEPLTTQFNEQLTETLGAG